MYLKYIKYGKDKIINLEHCLVIEKNGILSIKFILKTKNKWWLWISFLLILTIFCSINDIQTIFFVTEKSRDEIFDKIMFGLKNGDKFLDVTIYQSE